MVSLQYHAPWLSRRGIVTIDCGDLYGTRPLPSRVQGDQQTGHQLPQRFAAFLAHASGHALGCRPNADTGLMIPWCLIRCPPHDASRTPALVPSWASAERPSGSAARLFPASSLGVMDRPLLVTFSQSVDSRTRASRRFAAPPANVHLAISSAVTMGQSMPSPPRVMGVSPRASPRRRRTLRPSLATSHLTSARVGDDVHPLVVVGSAAMRRCGGWNVRGATMTMAMRRGLAGAMGLLVIGLHCVPGAAQDMDLRRGVPPIQSKGRFTIVTDNDLFYPVDPTDRFYSNGLFLHAEWLVPALDRATRSLVFPGSDPAPNRAYLGMGVAHELNTPTTLNPCGTQVGDPLTTSENPIVATHEECLRWEDEWAKNYAPDDRPFAAVAAFFVTAQRYFVAHNERQLWLSQGRFWARIDMGKWGSRGALGYEVQKHWHGFFNEFSKDPARDPIGWKLTPERQHVLREFSYGMDVSLVRAATSVSWWFCPAFGSELDLRTHLRFGDPRDDLGAGLTARAGCLPQHAREEVIPPGKVKPVGVFVAASVDGSAIATDRTYGDRDRYRHGLGSAELGVAVDLSGLRAGYFLDWERIAFENPLEDYSYEVVPQKYHRFGRLTAEFVF